MGKRDKQVARLLSGSADRNFPFQELVAILKWLGFEERIRGSHHIFSMSIVEEILNLQSDRGKAKPYQVKQVRDVIVKYGLVDQSGNDSDRQA